MNDAEMLKQIMEAERALMIPRGSTRAFIEQRKLCDLTGPTQAEEEVRTYRARFFATNRKLSDAIAALRDGEQPPSRRIEAAMELIGAALWILEDGE